MIRPGGTELTERALHLAGVLPGSTVFDIGCGSGETVRLLREKGYRAYGIDLVLQSDREYIQQADAETMPYEDGSADVLLFECSFSKMRNPEKVLKEAKRVLKENGKLVIADMISRKEENCFDGYLGRLESEEHLKDRLSEGGFGLQIEERQDASVNVFFGNLILEKGTEEAERLLGGCLQEIRKASPGYVLLVLKKNGIQEEIYRKIKAQAEYARQNSVYYGKTLPEITGKQGDLPFTDEEALRRKPEDFLCISQTRVKRVVTLDTSGTTGAKKRIYFSEKDLENTVRYFAEGMGPMVRAGETAGILFPGEGENGLPELIAAALKRLGVSAEVFRGCANADEEWARIEFCRGKNFLTGMPADLYRLSCRAPELRPRAVLLSGDDVPESLRNAVKKNWSCEVFEHYGMTEAGFGLAVECQAHDGLHIRAKDVFVEAVDPENGEPAPYGKPGELVISTLNREAMPLIRYRTGDLGILEESTPCICGNNTPKIRKISGRKEVPFGYPTIHDISEVLYSLPGVVAFDAHRCGTGKERRVTIRLECDGRAEPDTIKKHLETLFRGTLFDVIPSEEVISTVLKKHRL